MLFDYMKCRFLQVTEIWKKWRASEVQSIDHATLQRWVLRFVPLIDQGVRKRKKPVGNGWRMDETYIKVNGKCVYL